MGKLLRSLKLRLALFGRYLRKPLNSFLRAAPPGHFYSPIPDMEFIDRYQARLFDRSIKSIAGITERSNPDLRQMLRDLISERHAAGRSVPADVRDYVG